MNVFHRNVSLIIRNVAFSLIIHKNEYYKLFEINYNALIKISSINNLTTFYKTLLK